MKTRGGWKPGRKLRGRPRRLSREEAGEVRELYCSLEYNIRELADIYGVSRMCIWRALDAPDWNGGGSLGRF